MAKRKYNNGDFVRIIISKKGEAPQYVGFIGIISDEYTSMRSCCVKLRFSNRPIARQDEHIKYECLELIKILPGAIVWVGAEQHKVRAVYRNKCFIDGKPLAKYDDLYFPSDITDKLQYADDRIWIEGDTDHSVKITQSDKLNVRSGDKILPLGGLATVAIKLINKIPEHHFYISPFAGKDAVFRKIKRAAKRSILNDKNPVVYQWWQEQYLPNNSTDFHLFRDREITIMNRDYKELLQPDFINKFCSTFDDIFYLIDPPFLPQTRPGFDRNKYDYELTEKQHEELLDSCLNLVQKFHFVKIMVITYPADLYAQKLKGWERIEIAYPVRSRVQKVAKLHVYMSYSTPLPLHDVRFVGGNWDERRALKRKINRHVEKFKALPPEERAAIIKTLNEQFNSDGYVYTETA
jgi:hypothetical protein